MTIEEEVFLRKRFNFHSLEKNGFIHEGDRYTIRKPFMDGSFQAVFSVNEDGSFSGSVIDVMNEEEYAQLRMESFNGPYVNMVRTAYRELLGEIAQNCCVNVYFMSDQANRITELIRKKYSVSPDFPWKDETYGKAGVFRHSTGSKWFGLIMAVKRSALMKNGDNELSDVLNLKRSPSLTELPQGVYPAYHMNHRLWISVILDESLKDEVVMALVEQSFVLTEK